MCQGSIRRKMCREQVNNGDKECEEKLGYEFRHLQIYCSVLVLPDTKMGAVLWNIREA